MNNTKILVQLLKEEKRTFKCFVVVHFVGLFVLGFCLFGFVWVFFCFLRRFGPNIIPRLLVAQIVL